MMLMDNLPRVLADTRPLQRVLDIGGSAIRLNTATHVLDLLAPCGQLIAPQEDARCVEFVEHDMCKKPWPFADGYFDYAFCSGTLEDVRDPIGACEEMMRIARRGYIEVPSRVREIFHYKRLMRLRALLGRPLHVGYGHHRWFCEKEGGGLVFTAKTFTALQPRFVITRGELGRDLRPNEAWLGFFWDGPFPVSERVLIEPGRTEAEFLAFKQRALADLSTNTRL
ncbi:MAG: methyltransferase domain-containing protein [Rhizobiales bacterium]|nr:methyltransferase domain-containing protein [Hyphomicrobiales bacterium]